MCLTLLATLNNTIVLKNNIINVFNNYIIAIDTITKYPLYLLGSRAILYSIGLLDLEVYILNLKR